MTKDIYHTFSDNDGHFAYLITSVTYSTEGNKFQLVGASCRVTNKAIHDPHFLWDQSNAVDIRCKSIYEAVKQINSIIGEPVANYIKVRNSIGAELNKLKAELNLN